MDRPDYLGPHTLLFSTFITHILYLFSFQQ
jgi:hypothetical protein